MLANEPKQLLTKEFLETQVRALDETIQRNIGVLNFCKHLLKEKMYVESNGHLVEESKDLSPVK